MKLRTSVILQGLGVALQAANLAQPWIHNPKSQATLAAVVGGLQGIAALVAHFSNPDGTPASVAYIPDGATAPPARRAQ